MPWRTKGGFALKEDKYNTISTDSVVNLNKENDNNRVGGADDAWLLLDETKQMKKVHTPTSTLRLAIWPLPSVRRVLVCAWLNFKSRPQSSISKATLGTARHSGIGKGIGLFAPIFVFGIVEVLNHSSSSSSNWFTRKP
jgi:hypothetical protein